jgi:hypothetical protein
MKKFLFNLLPALALLTAAAPQAAFARDSHSPMTMQVRGDHDHDRDSWRGRDHGRRDHCRTVTSKHWNKWQHRMVYTTERVCRR